MNGTARPYLNPYVAGALLGTLLFLSFFITGGGLGASAGLNRVQVAADWTFLPRVMWTGSGIWPKWPAAPATL